MATQQYVAHIIYDGSNYAGFQIQKNSITIQHELEKALQILLKKKLRISFAGRTDAGVHAYQQMIAFYSPLILRSVKLFINSFNALLPNDIKCRKIYVCDDSFHPRFSCSAREYHYYIFNHPTQNIFFDKYSLWIKNELNIERMRESLNCIKGNCNFSAFTKQQSLPSNAVREVLQTDIIKRGDFVILRICSKGFLHHMVRNIVGTLIDIECRHNMKITFMEILKSHNRKQAGQTASAKGLFLYRLYYAKHHGSFAKEFSDLTEPLSF